MDSQAPLALVDNPLAAPLAAIDPAALARQLLVRLDRRRRLQPGVERGRGQRRDVAFDGRVGSASVGWRYLHPPGSIVRLLERADDVVVAAAADVIVVAVDVAAVLAGMAGERLAVESDIGACVDVYLDPVSAQGRVAGSGAAVLVTGHHEQAQRCVRGQVHLVGNHLAEAVDPGLGQSVQFCSHRGQVNQGAASTDLDDQLAVVLVHKRPGIMHPSASASPSIAVIAIVTGAARRPIVDKGDAGRTDILQTHGNFRPAPLQVVADAVGD